MMSTGVRTPVGIRIVAAGPGAAGRVGTRGARAALPARDAQRRVRSARRRDRLDSNPTARPSRASGRSGAGALDGRLADHRRRDRRGPATGDGCACASSPRPESCAAPADQMRDATVRGSRGAHGRRAAGSAGSARPLRVRALPATVRSRARPAVRLRLRRPRRRAPTSPATSSARGASRSARSATGQITLAPGERIEWTGQYDMLVAGQRRLCWIVPLVALSMLALLFLQFRSLTEALIVLVSVPFALVGSIWTLYVLGYSLSAPVWVGPALGGRSGDADRRGHGRVHRRGLLPARARRPDRSPRRHRRRARRGNRPPPPPEAHDHHHHGGRPPPLVVGGAGRGRRSCGGSLRR